jgi:hypothetical protein
MSTKKPPQCRAGCGAAVIWAQGPGGISLLFDKLPDQTGTSRYAVMRDTSLQLNARVLGDGDQPRPGIEKRHQLHRDTCTATRPEVGSE